MHKLHFLFLILSTIISLPALAQENYTIGYFQSFPIGKFGSTNLEDDGGFAKNGWGVMLENKSALRDWPENLYFGFHFSYQKNDFDVAVLEQAFTGSLGERFDVRIGSGSYKPFVVTVGPFYDWYLTEWFSIDLKTGIGVMFTNIDPIVLDVTNTENGTKLNQVFRFEGNPAFSYLVGADFGFQVSKTLKLGLFVNHSSASENIAPAFDTIETSTSKTKLAFLNAGIDLTLQFY